MNIAPREILFRFKRSRGLALVSDWLDLLKALEQKLPFETRSPDQKDPGGTTDDYMAAGLTAAEGPPGDRGPPGQPGPPGPPGYGPAGADGDMGAPGPRGDPAPPGPGPPGALGLPGEGGDIIDGDPGADGMPGPPGLPGPPGYPGPNSGAIGPEGSPGTDAVGLVPGLPGANAPGPSGETGTPGMGGGPGQPGDKGVVGPTGYEGPPGAKLAIVESCGKCVAFHVAESPRCLWLDHVQITMPAHRCRVRVPLDPVWLECLDARDGVEILSVHADGGGIAASIEGAEIVLNARVIKRALNVVVTVAGTARDHAGLRFPSFTREEMERNERFWASAFDPRIDTAPFFDLPDER